jgi:hypothetical protein
MDILLLSSSVYSAGIHLFFGQDQPDGSPIKMSEITEEEKVCGVKREKEKVRGKKGEVRGESCGKEKGEKGEEILPRFAPDALPQTGVSSR